MSRRIALIFCAVAIATTAPVVVLHAGAADATIERIRSTGTILLGYREDGRPFSRVDSNGIPSGYSIALCQQVVETARRELKLPSLSVKWIPVRAESRPELRFAMLEAGQIDLLCGADSATLARRARVDFSIPVFPGGIGALVREDAPARLQDVLAGRGQVFHPVWRAAATQVLQARDFSVVAGTTSQTWLSQRMNDLDVVAAVAPVQSYDEGIKRLADRRSDVFFGERAILLDAAKRHAGGRDLRMIDRQFTYEPLAFAVARGNDDFRLLVDRALSRLYRSAAIGAVYTSAFGEPDAATLAFFRWNALPE
jgi:ABC-type amino acid transport substrate-binding protein